MEVNRSINNKQYFGLAADLPKNLMSAISTCNTSKGPLKLQSVERSTSYFFSTNGVVTGVFSLTNNFFYPLKLYIYLQKLCP